MTNERATWAGFAIEALAIIAVVVLVALHAVSGRDALTWIGFVQTGRLYVWATRRKGDKKLPSESGLLLLLLAGGELARSIFARPHLPPS